METEINSHFILKKNNTNVGLQKIHFPVSNFGEVHDARDEII